MDFIKQPMPGKCVASVALILPCTMLCTVPWLAVYADTELTATLPSKHLPPLRKLLWSAHGNVTSKNDTEELCTHPSISEFPKDVFTQRQRRVGAVVLHILAAVYMFAGLAIVCDDYFVSALQKMCERMKVSEDVAGATFMAAGSSAPELFTSIIGVFITKGDVGVGTIVGSAVFNVLIIIALCCLFAGRIVYLTAWPLLRDSFFYVMSIAALIWTIHDGFVSWYESLVMLGIYGAYIFVMTLNSRIVRKIEELKSRRRNVSGVKTTSTAILTVDMETDGAVSCSQYELEKADSLAQKKPDAIGEIDATEDSPFACPQGSIARLVVWIISLPLVTILYVTIPDCRKPRWQAWYLLTFFMSVFWIMAFSYILVWMVSIIGYSLGIPDVIMGITFLAAGTSIPDAIASLLVSKQGMGDMALSNSIGSNVFDILVGLALPWFLQSVVVKPGSKITINSRGLIYSVWVLFASVFVAVLAIHCNRWRLTRPLGVLFVLVYVVVVAISALVEFNVFTFVNYPTCPYNG